MMHLELMEANSSPLIEEQNDNGIAKMSGFAVHEGTFNSITITTEELQKSVHTLIGKPLLVNHDSKTSSVVGKITNAQMGLDASVNKSSIMYDADFDAAEEDILRKIRLGFLNSTSVGFTCEHICSICGSDVWKCAHWFDDPGFEILAQDIQFRELSIVPIPADKDATVQINFSEQDKNRFEELKQQKETLRRTNMSDFEKKYNEAVDELSQMKLNHADEINKLKEDFKAEKDKLQLAKADKDSEVLALKNDIEALKQEKLELESTIKEYKETFAKIEEDKLSDLRKQVLELNEKTNFGLTEEEINDMSEVVLNRYINGFSSQLKHMVTIEKPTNHQMEANKGEQHQANPEKYESLSQHLSNKMMDKILSQKD